MKFVVILSVVACIAVVGAKPHARRNSLKEQIRELARQQIADELGVPPSAHQSSDYARGQNTANEAYDNAASGAERAAAHNAGRKEFHNVGQHHSKVTKITQKESSESHNIGGSVAYDKGTSAANRFHKHANGAKNIANDYEHGRQRSDIIYPN